MKPISSSVYKLSLTLCLSVLSFPSVAQNAPSQGEYRPNIGIGSPQRTLPGGTRAIPSRWESNQYQPPEGIGTPMRSEGGGTRGNLPENGENENVNPVPLVPSTSDNFGTTVAAYPTFMVYLPSTPSSANKPQQVEFILLNEAGELIYQTTYQTQLSSGVISISLPENAGLPPLEVNENYQWFFSIIPESLAASPTQVADGWIRRVTPNSQLRNQLEQLSLQEQARLYAENEIWYDAVATLAQAYRTNPGDRSVQADWQQLLTAAGLQNISQFSLVSSANGRTNSPTVLPLDRIEIPEL